MKWKLGLQSSLYRGYIGIMENKTEATILGYILGIVYWGYIKEQVAKSLTYTNSSTSFDTNLHTYTTPKTRLTLVDMQKHK